MSTNLVHMCQSYFCLWGKRIGANQYLIYPGSVQCACCKQVLLFCLYPLKLRTLCVHMWEASSLKIIRKLVHRVWKYRFFSSEVLNNPRLERLFPYYFSPDSNHHSPLKWWRRQRRCERRCRLHWWRLQTCSAELHHLVLLRSNREREKDNTGTNNGKSVRGRKGWEPMSDSHTFCLSLHPFPSLHFSFCCFHRLLAHSLSS